MPQNWTRRSKMVRPLLNIHCMWYATGYPDVLWVTMRDGRVVKYGREIKAIRIHTGDIYGWERTGKVVVGYQYREQKKSPEKVTSFLKRLLTRR